MTDLRDRAAALMLGALVRTPSALAPERDWSSAGSVHTHLRRTAKLSRDKAGHMVAAPDLLALGISLMETWAAGPPRRTTSRPVIGTA